MTTWKPYIFEGREYLTARSIQSWEDIVEQYPGVQIPRSELQKPYRWENYQVDEWSWPGWEPPHLWCEYIPDCFCLDCWDPPGGGNPCEAEDKCKTLGIVGPTKVECDDEVQFKNVLVFESCTLPPGIIVGWGASCGEIVSVSAIGARWRAPDCCDGDVCTVCASGPGCQACIEVTLDCVPEGCCNAFSIAGSATVNPGSTWTGSISPACPGASCSVVSNSGCSLSCSIDGAGSQVQVTPGADDCGSFTVTVTDEGAGCTEVASIGVRINNAGGAPNATWQTVITNPNKGCDTCVLGGSVFSYSPCITGDNLFKYGTGADCAANWSIQCKGEPSPACPGNCNYSHGTQPPCDSGKAPCAGTDPCGVGWCQFVQWNKCEWKCVC